METYHVLSVLLLAVLATGAQACDENELQGCVTSLLGIIGNVGTSPTSEDIKNLCRGVSDATNCVADKIKTCPENVQKQFNDQISAQKASFEEACKDYGGTGGSTGSASSLAAAGGVLAAGLFLARIL